MKVNGNLKQYNHYAFPMQAVLVTCIDEKKKTNVITIAWHTPISRTPPLYGISVAPNRHSHDLIKNSKEFVINFAPFKLVEKVDFCGTRSGRVIDKIKETNLTLKSAKKINTPIIQQCFAHFECTLDGMHTIGDHTLFIGKIVNISYDKHCFKDDLLDNKKCKPTYYLGNHIYTSINEERKKC